MRYSFILLVLFANLSFSCRAALLRGDLVSYSLDYYELQQRQQRKQETIRQKKQQQLDKKKEEALSRWNYRKEKINKFLNDLVISFDFKTTYNDNLFLSDTNKESDILNILSVNANYLPKTAWMRNKKTEFFFDFHGDGLSYSTGKAKQDTRTGLRTGLNYHISEKYAALIDYQFVRSQATASGGSGSDNEFVDNLTHIVTGRLNADWGRLPCSVRYEHEISNYEEEFKTSDYVRDTITATGNVKISAKTQFFLEYEMGGSTYPQDKESDYDFSSYSAGIRGRLSPKIVGVAKAGWGEYDYDTGSKRQTEILSGKLNYHLSRRLLIAASGERSTRASTYGTSDAAKQNSLSLQCRYFSPFNKKLSLGGGVRFANIKFIDFDRKDDITQLKLAAVYGLNKYAKFSLEYSRSARESNSENRDYVQNIISLKGTFNF